MFFKIFEDDFQVIKVMVNNFFESHDDTDGKDYIDFDVKIRVSNKNQVYDRRLDKIRYIVRKDIALGTNLIFVQSFDDMYEHLIFENISDKDMDNISFACDEFYKTLF